MMVKILKKLKLKVKTKLIAAFLMVSFFIVIVGGISINSLKSLSTNSNNMYSIGMQNVYLSLNIRANVSEIESSMLQILYVENSSNLQELENRIKDDLTEIASDMESLNSLSMNSVSSDVTSQLNSFIDLTNQLITYIDDNNYEGAIEKYNEVSTISITLSSNLDEVVSQHLTATKTVSTNNDTLAATNTTLIEVIIVVCVVLAIGLGLLVSRNINKPLTQQEPESKEKVSL